MRWNSGAHKLHTVAKAKMEERSFRINQLRNRWRHVARRIIRGSRLQPDGRIKKAGIRNPWRCYNSPQGKGLALRRTEEPLSRSNLQFQPGYRRLRPSGTPSENN